MGSLCGLFAQYTSKLEEDLAWEKWTLLVSEGLTGHGPRELGLQ